MNLNWTNWKNLIEIQYIGDLIALNFKNNVCTLLCKWQNFIGPFVINSNVIQVSHFAD